MAEIRWDLLQPVDTGALVQQGFNTGAAMVKQVQTRHALSAYLANPDDPQAYNALSFLDPGAAATLQNERLVQQKLERDRQSAEERARIGSLAANGDLPGAKAAAASAGDFDLVDTLNKMGDDERKRTLDKYTTAAPIAYQLSKLPYEKRREFIDVNRDELRAAGWSDQELDSFDPTDQALAGIVGVGSKLSELVSADKPQYIPFVPGGGVAAVQNGRVSTLIAPNPGDQPTGATVATTPTPSSTGGRRNNPGALRKPGSMQFQSFDTPEQGVQAQEALLGRYMGRGLKNVQSIVETYAPRRSKGGDNTDAQVNNYIAYVSRRLNVNPEDTLSSAMLPKLAAAMREFETGKRAPPSQLAASGGSDKAKIKADALEAIALGADPDQVRARAKAQGVDI